MLNQVPNLRVEKQLVLVGGGHAHIEVIRRWRMRPLPGVRLVVISSTPSSFYSGMIPGLVGGAYAASALTIDLCLLTRAAGGMFIPATVERIRPEAKRLELAGMPSLPYDIVSFDIGSTARALPLATHSPLVLATRPLSRLMEALADWDREILVEKRLAQERIVCVGAGAAGFELALNLRRRFQARAEGVSILLLDGGQKLSPRQLQYLSKMKVEVATAKAEGIEEKAGGISVRTSAGALGGTRLLWATGPAALPLFADSGLGDAGGWLPVNQYLQSPHHREVFGAGDCIAFPQPLDRAGVYAVREAPVLDANLRQALRGQWGQLRKFRPQRRYLRLLNCGDGSAILHYGRLRWRAPIFWQWKDKIDRSFMAKYRVAPLDPLANPDCGGCGSKISSQILSIALQQLNLTNGAGVEIGVGQREDIAVVEIGGARLGLSTDSFRTLALPPFATGRIAAVNASSDLYAKGVEPRFALAHITLVDAPAQLAASELEHLLAGARSVFGEDGTSIVGGQTLAGQEGQVGFTVLGNVASHFWLKSGMRRGDALVLTKPLGTGVLLAAAMRLALGGEELAALVRHLGQSQREAYAVLRAFAVGGATDVTGFGLYGHLQEMCKASGLGARIELAALPIYKGAADLWARGYQSRMALENRAAFGVAQPVLLDPQTCGGLLVSLPEDQVADCLAALAPSHPQAARVGQVVEGNIISLVG